MAETGEPRGSGPFDVEELPAGFPLAGRVDLGALLVAGREGIELRLSAQQEGGPVLAAMLVAADAAVELRPFAAPRGSAEFWDEVRTDIRTQVAAQGAPVEEVEGPWGPELHTVLGALDEGGNVVPQRARITGIVGPRWVLRATYFGVLATAHDPGHVIEQALRDLVVVRGKDAMPPGEQIPLRLPS